MFRLRFRQLNLVIVPMVFWARLQQVGVAVTYWISITVAAATRPFRALLLDRQCHSYGSYRSVLEVLSASVSTVSSVSPV
jgi:hypothetical protein